MHGPGVAHTPVLNLVGLIPRLAQQPAVGNLDCLLGQLEGTRLQSCPSALAPLLYLLQVD